MPTVTKYRNSTIYIDVNITNTGNVTETFQIGCSIIAPNGFITDLPLQYATLSDGANTTKHFSQYNGSATGIGYHTVAVAIYDSDGVELDRDETWRMYVPS